MPSQPSIVYIIQGKRYEEVMAGTHDTQVRLVDWWSVFNIYIYIIQGKQSEEVMADTHVTLSTHSCVCLPISIPSWLICMQNMILLACVCVCVCVCLPVSSQWSTVDFIMYRSLCLWHSHALLHIQRNWKGVGMVDRWRKGCKCHMCICGNAHCSWRPEAFHTTLLPLCREICLLAHHLYKTFNTFYNKMSTIQ